MTQRDEAWFAALAGEQAPADQPEAQELAAIRRAAAGLQGGGVDELAQQRLLRRLEAEGLLSSETRPATEGRRRSWRLPPGLSSVAVILLCVGVTLEWAVFSPPAEEVLESAPRGHKLAPALEEFADADRAPVAELRADRRAQTQLPAAEAAAAPVAPSARPAVAEDPPARQELESAALGEPQAERKEGTELGHARVATPDAVARLSRDARPAGAALASEQQATAVVEVLVPDPAATLAVLEKLAQADSTLRVQLLPAEKTASGLRRVTLSCSAPSGCNRLNRWLVEQKLEQRMAPGQALEVRLGQRP